MNTKKITDLLSGINAIRDLRARTINSDVLNEEQLYYLQEGFREGLATAAIRLARQIDKICSDDGIPSRYFEISEEKWWHTHTDEKNGDKGTDDRW